MRFLFLALVGCVALALVAALLAPRLVDREALRQELRRIAVRSLGEDLTIKGPVAIDLFPRPRLIASRLSSGPTGDGDGQAEIQIDRVRLELSPLALLIGRIEVQRIQLVRPLLRLDGPGMQRLGAALLAGTEHVAGLDIVKGTLEATSSPLAATKLEAVDLTLVRNAETGALDLDGRAFVHDQPIRFVAQSGPLEGTAPASGRITIGRGDAALTATFNGTLDTAATLKTVSGKLRIETSEVGLAPNLLGTVLGRDGVLTLPTLGHAWLEGRLAVDRTSLVLDDMVAELPDGAARGSLIVGFAPKPTVTADLKVDKTRLKAGLEAILGRAVRDQLAPPLLTRTTGRLDVQASSLTVRDAAIGNARVALTWTGDGKARIERAVALLPGGTDVRFQGDTSVNEGWRGSLEVSGDDLRKTLSWLDLPLEAMPPQGLRSAHGTLALDVVGGRTIVEAKDFLLDTTKLAGRAALVKGERPKLAIVGSADRIDLGAYLASQDDRPDVSALQTLLGEVDLSVDAAAGRVVWQRLMADGVKLSGATDHGRFRLDELRTAGLGGAEGRLVGDGALDGSEGSLAVEARAERISRPLRAFGLLPPLGLDQLGAAYLAGTARWSPDGDDVDLTLTTKALEVDVAGDPGDQKLRLSLNAAAPDLATLVEAMGGPAGVALPAAVPVHASGELKRDGEALVLGANLSLGDTDAELDLRRRLDGDRPVITGSVGVDGLDPAYVLLGGDLVAGALALPPIERWVGDWPRDPLPWHGLDAIDLDLAVTASLKGEGDADGDTIGARIGLSDGQLAVHDLDVPLAGGRLNGVLTLDATPDENGVFGADLALSGARAERLLPAAAATHGELDLDVSVAAAGWSPADLVGNLAGSGRVRLKHGGVADDAALADLLLIEGPLHFDRGIASTPASGLTLRVPGGEGTVRLDADLLAWVAKIRTEAFTFEAPDKVATIEALGPIGRMHTVSRNLAAAAP